MQRQKLFVKLIWEKIFQTRHIFKWNYFFKTTSIFGHEFLIQIAVWVHFPGQNLHFLHHVRIRLRIGQVESQFQRVTVDLKLLKINLFKISNKSQDYKKY